MTFFRFTFAGLCLTCGAGFGDSGFLTADADQDRQVSIAEVRAAWQSAGASPLDNSAYQQTEFIWKAGSSYQAVPGPPEPWCFTPAGYMSVSDRYPRSLSLIEVFAGDEATSVTGEFRIEADDEWVALDLNETTDGGWMMMVPYVPSFWFEDQRLIELRFRVDGALSAGGKIRLQKIDRTRVNFDFFYEEQIAGIDRIGNALGISAASAEREVLRKELAEDSVEGLLGAARLSMGYGQKLMSSLRESGSSGENVVLINEEIMALTFEPARDEGGWFPAVAQPRRRSKSNESIGCPPITSWQDLAIESQERCRLENEVPVLEQLAEFTGLPDAEEYLGKLGEKVEELGEKASEKFVTEADKASSRTAALPIFAVKAAYEAYQFKNEWNKQQGPKTVVKFDYEVGPEQLFGTRNFFREDSIPFQACEQASLKVFAHVVSDGFDSAEFLRDKIPSITDFTPEALSNYGPLKDVVEDLAETGEEVALDWVEDKYREDLRITPCRWPADENGKGIELDRLLHFQLRDLAGSSLRVVDGLTDTIEPKSIGRGPVEVRLKTGTSGSDLCLEPFTDEFEFEVKPIRVVFDPTVYSINDVDDSLTLSANMEDSNDTRAAAWRFRDRRGRLLDQLIELDGEVTLSLPAATTSSTKTHQITINPPDDLDLYPLTVIAYSRAEGCLRDEGRQLGVRKGFAKIFYQAKAFEIVGGRECLPQGFSAALSISAAPGVTDLDIEWSVPGGGAVITKTSQDTASITMGDSPRGDVEVVARGADGFEARTYFAIGPCWNLVTLGSFFSPQLIENPVVDTRYSHSAGAANLTFSGSPSSQGEVFDPTSAGGGFQQTIGALDHIVEDVDILDEDLGLKSVRTRFSGYFFQFLNTSNITSPNPWDIDYTEIRNGTFFTDKNESNFLVPPFPTDLRFNSERTEIRVTFIGSLGIDPDEGVTPTITMNGVQEDLQYDGETFVLTVRWPVDEWEPTVDIRMFGTVVENGETMSVAFESKSVYRPLLIRGTSRFKVRAIEQEVTGCLPPGPMAEPAELVLSGCCGSLEIYDAVDPGLIGAARQFLSAGTLSMTEGDVQERGASVSLNFSSDPSVPYCSEVERLIEELEDPDPDPENPNDDDDPSFPPELSPFFMGNPPSDDPGKPFGSPQPGEFGQGGSSGVVLDGGAGLVRYPWIERDFISNTIRLGTFSLATGQKTMQTTLIDFDGLGFLTFFPRLVSVIDPGDSVQSGFLIERQDFSDEVVDPVTTIDFWEYDQAEGKMNGRTLLNGASLRFINFGDFNGDGLGDLLGIDQFDTRRLRIRPGLAAGGFGDAEPFHSGVGNVSAISLLAGSDASLIVETGLQIRVIKREVDGSLSPSVEVINPPGGTVASMADFNSDGVPDLLMKAFVPEGEFTVIYLDSDGVEVSRQVFDTDGPTILPGL